MKKVCKFNLFFELLLLVAVLVSHFLVVIAPENKLLNWYLTDDAFYYFKTAQNISEGRGITFDGISTTNGFHPLWMLLCVPVFALARYDIYLPLRVLVLIQALLTACSGILIYRLLSRNLSKHVGMITALIWVFYPPIHSLTTMLGMESGINAFFIIFLFYSVDLYINDHQVSGSRSLGSYLLLSLIAVFTLFSRLDNIFLVLLLGFWLVFKDNSLRWFILLDVAILLIICVTCYFLRVQTLHKYFPPFFLAFVCFSILFKILCAYLMRVYHSTQNKETVRYLGITVLAISIGSALTAGCISLLHNGFKLFSGFPRSVLLLDWGFSVVLFPLTHLVITHSRKNIKEDLSFSKHWRVWLSRAAAYFGPILAVLCCYMLINTWYSGTAMPISGQIKRWWGSLPNTVYGTPIYTISEFISSWFSPTSKDGPWSLILGPINRLGWAISHWASSDLSVQETSISIIVVVTLLLLLAWIVSLFWKQWHWLFSKLDHLALWPFFVATILHIVSYKATGYLHAKFWYWVSEMVLIVFLGGLVMERLFSIIFKWKYGHIMIHSFAIILGFLTFSIFSYNIWLQYNRIESSNELHNYFIESQIIQENTDVGSVIGMTGGGVTAYFVQDRTIVNLDGLINGIDYYHQLRQGNADEYFNRIHLKYVFGAESMLLDSDPYRWVFTDRLKTINSFGGSTLYRFQLPEQLE